MELKPNEIVWFPLLTVITKVDEPVPAELVAEIVALKTPFELGYLK